jgi:hypothetical protein
MKISLETKAKAFAAIVAIAPIFLGYPLIRFNGAFDSFIKTRNYLDRNRDGRISYEEKIIFYKDYLAQKGYTLRENSPKDISSFFRTELEMVFDSNDKLVNRSELVKLLRK